MKKQIYIIVIAIALLAADTTVFAQSVSITEVSPGPTASLNYDQKVTINFTYSTRQSNGVRIFIRPVTSGNLTPDYAASGSPVYPRGSGDGSANFTITKGDVTVDQLRVRMVSSNQNRLVFEFYFPVNLTFSSTPKAVVYPKALNLNKKTMKALQKQLSVVDKKDKDTEESDPDKRIVKPDGTIEIYKADGTIEVIEPSGTRYTVYPETGDTLWAQQFYIEVQDNEEPASPPGFMATTEEEANEEWLVNLNAWVKHLGSQLLDRIEFLLDDKSSLENYKNFEEKNSDTIYEKVNLRYTFLEKLLEYDS